MKGEVIINNIQSLRERANLTQEQLAEKLNLTQVAISKWESGLAFPRTAILPKLALILNCKIEDLY